MNEKMIEIIILDDMQEQEICQNIQKGLKKLDFTKINMAKIKVTGFKRVAKLLVYLEKRHWSYINSVLIDFTLLNPENDAEHQTPDAISLIKIIKAKNPAIDLYGMTSKNLYDPSLLDFLKESNLINKNELLNEDDCVNEILRIIKNPIQKKMATPFWDAFRKYDGETTHSWHVPGHNKGLALKKAYFGNEFYDFFGEKVFKTDHAVPKNFGSIFTSNSNNVIEETQRKIAGSFNTKKTFFVTNGNTTANNIILLSILKPKDQVLVARSSHKSIHNAMILSGANPTYLKSIFSKKYEVMAPPSIEEIEEKLKAKEKGYYRLLIVTGCGYEGIVMDIRKLNSLCKNYGTELFVDEAWYGYSNFHPIYQNTSATRLGVPYVTQSAHKMLSALRQSAFIHINSNRIDLDYFKDIYNTFTSTSPQYQLIASMDVAVMQMRMEGFELIERALRSVLNFKQTFNDFDMQNISIVEEKDLAIEFEKEGFDFKKENIFVDPLKISFDISKTGLDISIVYDIIKEEAIVDLVKYTKNCIQILFTIGTSFDDNKIINLAKALKEVDKRSIPFDNLQATKIIAPSILELNYEDDLLPRDYFYAERKPIEIRNALGQRSATLVTPYPPGIPLLVPGEVIKESHIDYLEEINKLGHISIHGLNENQKIFVICNEG